MTALEEYQAWWDGHSLFWRMWNRLGWRFSYLWAFFFGGPCTAERLLLALWSKEEEDRRRQAAENASTA